MTKNKKNANTSDVASKKSNLMPPYSKTNRPDPKKISEGMKRYWEQRKTGEKAREEVLQAMYRQAGFKDDGTSKLNEAIANKALIALNEGNMNTFMKLWQDIMPNKETTQNITGIDIPYQAYQPNKKKVKDVKSKLTAKSEKETE